MFKGCCTALITPFTKDNKVNFIEFENIIEKQIAGGVSALLFLGTTGESPTLDEKEKEEIISFAVQKVNKRVPVLVGAGTNSTEKTIDNIKSYERFGVDGFLTGIDDIRCQSGLLQKDMGFNNVQYQQYSKHHPGNTDPSENVLIALYPFHTCCTSFCWASTISRNSEQSASTWS